MAERSERTDLRVGIKIVDMELNGSKSRLTSRSWGREWFDLVDLDWVVFHDGSNTEVV